MKNSGFAAVIIILLVVVGIIAVGAFMLLKNQAIPSITPTQSPVSIPQVTVATPSPSPVSSLPAGWSTYKNATYGFEISHPKSYQSLDSKDDLSGYPKGVLLLYTGGQAYDVVIEVWDTKAEYESEYGPRIGDLSVFESNGKFITVLNNTPTTENKEVINSFKLVGQ